MDRKELVESSSSPNVNLSIASIQKRGAGKETIAVSLSDGSSFFMPLPLPEDWSPGISLNEEQLEHLENEDAYVRGKEWAAGRLAAREDSSGRMLQKLAKKGWGGAVGLRILEDLERLGFLDDLRFAELWLRERLRSHPEGKDALLAGLISRGVPSRTAREALDEYISPDDLDKALERCIEKLHPQSSLDKSEKDKLIRKLQRRGFSYQKIIRKL